MNSKELSKRLSDGKIDNLYLFYGEEDYIKRKGVFVPYESDVKIVKRLFKIE